MGSEKLSSRTLLLHGAVYTASRILNQAASFVLLPLYAHLLGSLGVGVIEVMNVARTFLGILLGQGLDTAWFRLGFQFDSNDDDRRSFESTVFWYLAASSAIGVALLAAFGNGLAPILTPGVPFFPLGLLTAVTAAATVFSNLVERKLQAERRPAAFAMFGLVRTVATTLVVIVFVAMLARGAAGKIEAEAVAAVVAAACSAVLLRPKARFSRTHLRAGLAYGLPLVPHNLAWFANNLLDRFLVNGLLGLQAVGVYSMGYRLASIGMLVGMAVNQAFAPVFIEGVRAVEREEADGRTDAADSLRKRIASMGFLTVIVACLLSQVITATGREVLFVATTRQFSESWRVLAPVGGGVVAWAWYATLSQSIAYSPTTVRRLPLITVAAAGANVLANLLLIRRFGIDGAAWATFISNSLMAVLAFFLGRRLLPLPYAFGRWIAVSLFTALSLALLFAIDRSLDALVLRAAVKGVWLAVSLGATIALSGTRSRVLFELLRKRSRETSTDG